MHAIDLSGGLIWLDDRANFVGWTLGVLSYLCHVQSPLTVSLGISLETLL